MEHCSSGDTAHSGPEPEPGRWNLMRDRKKNIIPKNRGGLNQNRNDYDCWLGLEGRGQHEEVLWYKSLVWWQRNYWGEGRINRQLSIRMDCGIRLHHIIHLTGSLNKYNVNNKLAKNIFTVSQSPNLTVSQSHNLTVLQYQNLSHTISKYNITVNISIFRITILQ